MKVEINMNKNNIYLTKKLIDYYKLTIPIDLNKIISDFSDIEIEYDSDISKDNLIKFNKENGYLIQIKNKEFDIDNPKGYKNRFTIANSLGHLFLEHIDKKTKHLYNRNQQTRNTSQ